MLNSKDSKAIREVSDKAISSRTSTLLIQKCTILHTQVYGSYIGDLYTLYTHKYSMHHCV